MKQEEVWDNLAKPWQEFRHCKVAGISKFLNGKKGKILDLGCGCGRNFVKDKNLEFYGVDFSEEMVRLAEGMRIAKKVKKSDVSEIPYDDEFFDFIIFSAVLHCVDSAKKRKKALEECYRVLKRGGEMFVSVWGRGQSRLKNQEKEGFVPWTHEGKKFERYTYIYDRDELVGDLESVGFEIMSVEEGKEIVVVVRKG